MFVQIQLQIPRKFLRKLLQKKGGKNLRHNMYEFWELKGIGKSRRGKAIIK